MVNQKKKDEQEAGRWIIQQLFEKMADRHPGKVEIRRWSKDSTATIRVDDELRKIKWCWNEGGIPLVCVQKMPRDGDDHVFVTPSPGAVLALILHT